MQQQSARQERLADYRRKRDFTRTLEPSGADAAVEEGCLYVMHKHAASHDHFDLRLEENGVLRSWALPKGASLEPGEKRLAVEVEDHPLEYGGFEGVIPEGEYGGGTVMLWDAGRWRLNGRNKEGHIDFILEGQKLKGAWTLVRTRGMKGGRGKEGKSWLMIKRSDPGAARLAPGDDSVATGRSMEEIAHDRDNVWLKDGAHAIERAPPPDVAGIERARKTPMPDDAAPQLATPADAVPDGDNWVHEIKFDGYRLIAHLAGGKVRLLTRNGHDWASRFPELGRTLQRLPIERAIIDGEVVALANGYSSFHRLQDALSTGRTENLVYQAFDLLHLDDHDLTGVTLLERKRALAALLEAADNTSLRYSDHIQGNGPEFFEQACQLGLEGIISKRTNDTYRSGRSGQWLKIKCTQHEEFVVGGYLPPGGSRKGFRSLLLGAYRNGVFEYAGRVGSGFSDRQLEDIERRLAALAAGRKPFHGEVPDARGAHWVRPVLVVEVEFTERTRDGRLRHPVFRGIREDREPGEIHWHEEVDMREHTGKVATTRGRSRPGEARVADVRITHPERVIFPGQGITKAELARYYEEIGDWMLPYIANRPLSLLRCPEGRAQECFFQKHLARTQAKDVPRTKFRESRGVKEYAYASDISHIVALVQAGVLEFHPFGSQIDDVEHPDVMVFDLDPAPEVPWRAMLDAARDLHARIDAFGLAGFLRTTGGKGLHIVVPLEPRADWDEVKAFAQAVAERHAADDPSHFTANMSKAKRRGKIFIDYLRNARGATAIASYSVRAREGAPVAVPLRWDELGAGLRGDRYTMGNLRRRLGALDADPWSGFFDARVPLTAAMRKKAGMDH